MENKRIAKFFVETLIGEKIDAIAVVPQEYTCKRIRKKRVKEVEFKEEIFSIIRFDFVATIRTSGGEHKKVLIEIQKSRKATDLLRFRTYLGEQYKRVDAIDTSTGKIEKSLPVICIYLLGFNLSGHKTKASRTGRISWDLIAKKEIKEKDNFVEALTHDAYFVQIPRIKGKPRTLLEKMLSIFEQEYFIDDKNIVKKYKHPVDNDVIEEMVDVLRNVAADPEEKRAIEEEWLAIKDEEGYEQAIKAIEDKNKALEEKDKALEENKKNIADLQKEVAALRQRFGV